MTERYKIVVYVPSSHAEAVREAMGEAGAGIIGTYSHCTFTISGITRFKPGPGSDPAIGEIGKVAVVPEDRIETVATADNLKAALAAIRSVHPHEEPAMDVYPVELIT
jgi:hypothetical protein